MYKMVASDLDGTLLTSNHQIPPFSQQVLSQLHQQGIAFIFATGRHHIDVAYMREKLGIPAFMITSNGARVHNCENELVFKQNLAPEIVGKIVEMVADDDQIIINIYRDNDWLLNKVNPNVPMIRDHFPYEFFDVRNPPVDNVAKIFLTRVNRDHNKLVEWETVFNAEFTDSANIAFSTPHCLEIMDSNVSKGHALQAIAEMAGYQLKDCIAFGDGMNDFEMLSMAGKGLVMGTAHHKVKTALPNIEVIGNCDDEAVAHYIATHLLNKTKI
ncbi:Cof-type HAD-IIB family hydrolase [Psychromonas algicola]|uniref:Cof-type HAD-IIB family hydrolase n=1 Tax=Psychromonas algicola TaxID=2555642 RepID=UPI0010686DEA|nr:Cof-type HAD-IIB family hydrolase [Psychromonas sp. RZ5]TEW44753.1 Cof-type HAD-IIB family hydrolase [Psychromonas sp. RZ5]